MTCFIFHTDPILVFFKRGVDSGAAYRGPQGNTQDLLYFIDEQLGRLPKVTKFQIQKSKFECDNSGNKKYFI